MAPEDADDISLEIHRLFSEEMQRVPATIRPFISDNTNRYESWEYFIGSYGKAFDILVENALRAFPDPQLNVAIMYLCRHAIELSIKDAIIAYAESAGQQDPVLSHNLLLLWGELMRQTEAAGFDNSDEWTVYCGRLVEYIHSFDATGERFRYPANRRGVLFEMPDIDLKQLALAHWHVGMLCDGAIGMLDALGRQS